MAEVGDVMGFGAMNAQDGLGVAHYTGEWHNGPKEIVFVLGHLSVVVGCIFAALWVVPLLPVRSFTRATATVFFLLCALLHADMILSTFVYQRLPWGIVLRSWHMLILAVLEGFGVTAFVVGFFRDLATLKRRSE